MAKSPRNDKQTIETITKLVSETFRCFGGNWDARNEPCPNPIAIAMQGKPPTFAAGVDVQQVVVAFVLGASNQL